MACVTVCVLMYATYFVCVLPGPSSILTAGGPGGDPLEALGGGRSRRGVSSAGLGAQGVSPLGSLRSGNSKLTAECCLQFITLRVVVYAFFIHLARPRDPLVAMTIFEGLLCSVRRPFDMSTIEPLVPCTCKWSQVEAW